MSSYIWKEARTVVIGFKMQQLTTPSLIHIPTITVVDVGKYGAQINWPMGLP